MEKTNFSIASLGECKIHSPIALSDTQGDLIANYVSEDEYIRFKIDAKPGEIEKPLENFDLIEKAGPRKKIFFSPNYVHAAIATCGGLCPGINDVIRAIVRGLWDRYGVRRISGIKFGYKGFLPENGLSPIELNPQVVREIHKTGGSFLGSSRGDGTRTAEIVDGIEQMNINMVFLIGGDGTQKGSLAIAKEIERRKLKISVIGIPKTIDNDLSFIQKSFGFDTAIAKATESVAAANMEASSQINGVGLVKLMGRESGFIATHTAIASHEAHFVLIPEIPFKLEGENGFFKNLENKLKENGFALIVLAEGAGQNLMKVEEELDASGNKKLGDIGLFLKDKLAEHFKKIGTHINIKYIDPSYQIRAAVAAPIDSVYCERLGNHAVHAAMAGKTRMLVGLVHDKFVHLPIEAVVGKRKLVDPESSLWRDALDATGQAAKMI